MVNKMLTVQEAMIELDCSRDTIYRWIRSGKLKAVQAYGKTLFTRKAIERAKKRSK